MEEKEGRWLILPILLMKEQKRYVETGITDEIKERLDFEL
jgi:hypothetical protein